MGAAADADDGEAGEVVGGREQVEIGVYFVASPYSCSSATVAASHQVSEFAFDFGSGGPVVRTPVRVALTRPGGMTLAEVRCAASISSRKPDRSPPVSRSITTPNAPKLDDCRHCS